MSGDGIHQPLLSSYTVIDDQTAPHGQSGRNTGRCFCGWRGPPRKRAWEASRDVADHIAGQRRKK